MDMNLSHVLLVICLPYCSHGKHVLRFLTFCQTRDPFEGQYDFEFDGDQLLYVDPFTGNAIQRLPEFAEQWTPDPGLAEDEYVAVGTCHYNIGIFVKRFGEGYPPESIVIPSLMIYPRQRTEPGVPNTLICLVDDLHPPAVNITWTRNGQLVDLSDVSQTQYYSNSDFSFRKFSYLDFTPQEGDIYSCSVHHISLKMPLTQFWEYEVHTEQQAADTAVCVGGVILGLIGLVTGLWFIAKANKSCQA